MDFYLQGYADGFLDLVPVGVSQEYIDGWIDGLLERIAEDFESNVSPPEF